jgi:hypothetical protein
MTRTPHDQFAKQYLDLTIPSPFFERCSIRKATPSRFWPQQKPGFCEKPGFLGVRVERMSVLAQEKKPGWQKTWFLAKNRVS